jgi:hypothetical protein
MPMFGFVMPSASRRLAVSFVGTLLATNCVASAETLTYTLGTITGQDLTIVTPSAGAGLTTAGLINLTTASGSVEVWCIDLPNAFVQTGGTYSVGSSAVLNGSPGVPFLTSNQIGEIGALVKHGAPMVSNPGPYTAEQVAAALQIAMWDIEYGASAPDGFTYSAALGSPIDAAPPSPGGLVGQFLADVGPGKAWGEDTGFNVLYSNAAPVGQTLLTGAPEPSVWTMMLIGFAGLGYAGSAGRTNRAEG